MATGSASGTGASLDAGTAAYRADMENITKNQQETSKIAAEEGAKQGQARAIGQAGQQVK